MNGTAHLEGEPSHVADDGAVFLRARGARDLVLEAGTGVGRQLPEDTFVSLHVRAAVSVAASGDADDDGRGEAQEGGRAGQAEVDEVSKVRRGRAPPGRHLAGTPIPPRAKRRGSTQALNRPPDQTARRSGRGPSSTAISRRPFVFRSRVRSAR